MEPTTGIHSRDHNATSYSTETKVISRLLALFQTAEIITLRAIALKRMNCEDNVGKEEQRS